MMCPMSTVEMPSPVSSSRHDEDLHISSEVTSRSLILLAADIKTILKSWHKVDDKTEFAKNVFMRLFRYDPELETRFRKIRKGLPKTLEVPVIGRSPLHVSAGEYAKAFIEPPSTSQNSEAPPTKRGPAVEYLAKEETSFSTTAHSDSGISSEPNDGQPNTAKPKRKNAHRQKAPRKSRTFTALESVAGSMRRIKAGMTQRRSNSYQTPECLRRSRNELANVKDIVFEVMALNISPIYFVAQPILTAGAPIDKTSMKTPKLTPRIDRYDAYQKRHSFDIIAGRSPLLDESRRMSLEAVMARLARRPIPDADDYTLPHLDGFIDFWNRIMQVFCTYEADRDQKEASRTLVGHVREIGESHAKIKTATFDGRISLFMKSAFLEQILQYDEGRRNSRCRSNSSPNVDAMKLVKRIRSPGFEGNPDKMSRHSLRRCQIMRAWYKLLSFVMAEAKDAYLAGIMRDKSSPRPLMAKLSSGGMRKKAADRLNYPVGPTKKRSAPDPGIDHTAVHRTPWHKWSTRDNPFPTSRSAENFLL